MVKQILAVIILVLFLSVSASACILPGGTNVFIFTPQGMMAIVVPGDQLVVLHDEQPTAKRLKGFSDNNPGVGDWSDGVAVYDDDDNVSALVHKGDLMGECVVPGGE